MSFSLRRWIASIDNKPNANVKLEVIDLSVYCRTCMNETVGTDFYMLDSTDNVTLGNETLQQILDKLIGVTSNENDPDQAIKPNRICLTCYNTLTQYYVFRNECLQSYNAMEKYIRILNQKKIEQAIDTTPTASTNTATQGLTEIDESGESKDNAGESIETVMIKVEVDDGEYIIDAMLEDENEMSNFNDDHNYSNIAADSDAPTNDAAAIDSEINDFPSGSSLHDDSNSRESGETLFQLAYDQIESISKRYRNQGLVVDEPEHEMDCILCGKRLSTKRRLTKHLKAHMPDHKCPFCEKHFGKSFALRRHVRNHSAQNLSSFKAPCCYRRFKKKDHVAIHYKAHIEANESGNLAYKMLKQSNLIETEFKQVDL